MRLAIRGKTWAHVPEANTERRVPQPLPLAQRFWVKVARSSDVDACWLWTAGRFGRTGCACFSLSSGRSTTAARVAYELTYGPIPPGMWVCHTCEGRYPPGDLTHRLCVNPAHLKLGTAKENTADMLRSGRVATGMRSGAYTHPERLPRGDRHGLRMHPERAARGVRNGAWTHPEARPRGESQGSARLTEADILVIRARRACGEKLAAIATEYDITEQQVWKIVHRRAWTHVS